MAQLSPAGQQLVQDLAQRHGVSTDAVTHMLTAIRNGNGTMAQFNHPEWGGGGQWMSGGMTMVSDLFNNHLKGRVDSICCDLSNALANHQLSPIGGSFQSQSQSGSGQQHQGAGNPGGQNDLFAFDPEQNWWPQDLGSPSATGSQNNVKYAYFAGPARLAVKTGNSTWVYDTLNHNIGGFSQQQGGGSTISFSSQFGTINLNSLPVVTRDGKSVPPPAPQQPAPSTSSSSSFAPPTNYDSSGSGNSGSNDILATLEKLGQLKSQGIVSDDEFNRKKAELLGRL